MRLSEAVFQGQISRLRFSLLESIFSCLFLLSGFCKRRFEWVLRLSEAVFQGQISRLSDVAAVFAVAVLRDLGSNPAAV